MVYFHRTQTLERDIGMRTKSCEKEKERTRMVGALVSERMHIDWSDSRPFILTCIHRCCPGLQAQAQLKEALKTNNFQKSATLSRDHRFMCQVASSLPGMYPLGLGEKSFP